MRPDPDLLRGTLLYLEQRQVSPRSTVIIDIRAESGELLLLEEALEAALNLLLALDYIEGPGTQGNGFWLFRKLTQKGAALVRAARDPADWARLKNRLFIAG